MITIFCLHWPAAQSAKNCCHPITAAGPSNHCVIVWSHDDLLLHHTSCSVSVISTFAAMAWIIEKLTDESTKLFLEQPGFFSHHALFIHLVNCQIQVLHNRLHRPLSDPFGRPMGYERRFLGQISCCSLSCLLSALICFLRVVKNKGLAYQSFASALNKERIPEPHEFLESVILNVEAGGRCKAFMIKDCKRSKRLLWFNGVLWLYDKYLYIYVSGIFFCTAVSSSCSRRRRSMMPTDSWGAQGAQWMGVLLFKLNQIKVLRSQ